MEASLYMVRWYSVTNSKYRVGFVILLKQNCVTFQKWLRQPPQRQQQQPQPSPQNHLHQLLKSQKGTKNEEEIEKGKGLLIGKVLIILMIMNKKSMI